MPVSGADVVVLICDGHQGEGQDLATLTALTTRLLPRTSVRVVHNMCVRPRALTRAQRELRGQVVVLSPCKAHAAQGLRITQLHDAARDPRIPFERIVVLDPAARIGSNAAQCVQLHAIALTAAATAEAPLAQPLAPVESSAGINRRALLTGRLHARQPVPKLADGPCPASPRCHLCVDSCPSSALSMGGGLPLVDTTACNGCAACVTACPADVIHLDSLPRHAWAAYLTHVMTAARQLELPLGISWTCQRAAIGTSPADEMAWLTLRPACVRALTLAWLLQPVAAGAMAVAVTPCASCVIPSEAGNGRAQLVRRLLGSPTRDAVSSTPRRRSTASADGNRHVLLGEPAASADALRRLRIATAQFVGSPASPLGVVDCDTSRCTACGLCAERCPTGALTIQAAPGSRTLAFTHGACAACGACTATCPEAALTLRRGVDPTALTDSRALAVTAVRECASCRAALPSPAMVVRLAAAGVSVPDDGICGDCRSAGRSVRRTTVPPTPATCVPIQS